MSQRHMNDIQYNVTGLYELLKCWRRSLIMCTQHLQLITMSWDSNSNSFHFTMWFSPLWDDPPDVWFFLQGVWQIWHPSCLQRAPPCWWKRRSAALRSQRLKHLLVSETDREWDHNSSVPVISEQNYENQKNITKMTEKWIKNVRQTWIIYDEGYIHLCELVQAAGYLVDVGTLVIIVLCPMARAVTPAPRPLLLRGGAIAGYRTRKEGHESSQRLRPPVHSAHQHTNKHLLVHWY